MHLTVGATAGSALRIYCKDERERERELLGCFSFMWSNYYKYTIAGQGLFASHLSLHNLIIRGFSHWRREPLFDQLEVIYQQWTKKRKNRSIKSILTMT